MCVKYAHHGRWSGCASNPPRQLRSPMHQPLAQFHPGGYPIRYHFSYKSLSRNCGRANVNAAQIVHFPV